MAAAIALEKSLSGVDSDDVALADNRDVSMFVDKWQS
jgi:hypothetical protein